MIIHNRHYFKFLQTTEQLKKEVRNKDLARKIIERNLKVKELMKAVNNNMEGAQQLILDIILK